MHVLEPKPLRKHIKFNDVDDNANFDCPYYNFCLDQMWEVVYERQYPAGGWTCKDCLFYYRVWPKKEVEIYTTDEYLLHAISLDPYEDEYGFEEEDLDFLEEEFGI